MNDDALRVCSVCGIHIVGNITKLYCSPRCNRKACWARTSAKRKALRPPCPVCGSTIKGRALVYCSGTCRARANHRHKAGHPIENPKPFSCAVCGVEVAGKFKRLYCSPSCSNKACKRRHPEKYKERFRSWETRNKEKRKAKSKAYRENNRQRCIERCRQWHVQNPDKTGRDQQRKWRAQNPEKAAESIRRSNQKARERRALQTITQLQEHLNEQPATPTPLS